MALVNGWGMGVLGGDMGRNGFWNEDKKKLEEMKLIFKEVVKNTHVQHVEMPKQFHVVTIRRSWLCSPHVDWKAHRQTAD